MAENSNGRQADGSSTAGKRKAKPRAGAARRQDKKSSGGMPPVRFAVVGLGHIAQAAVLPAFAHAKKHVELAALVSDDPQKLRELGGRYGVTALHDYRDYPRCLQEHAIDAVYIATPNSEHMPFACDAADAGVHVLCEKPLGVSERDCLEIIRACERNRVSLMTAYRLHFEAANLKALEAIRAGRIGRPRLFTSVFSYQVKDQDNIRLDADLGGGPLHDIGIYCINAARAVFQDEPVQVHAWSLDAARGSGRFDEVAPTITAQLRFPGERLATFTCSFGVAAAGWFQVLGDKGDIRLDPAYDYTEPLEMTLTVDDKSRTRAFAKRDQFAAELVYFAKCLQEQREPEPSGWEGLADVRIIRALEQSIRRSCALDLPPLPGPRLRYPEPEQRIDRPPVPREPRLVHARSASA